MDGQRNCAELAPLPVSDPVDGYGRGVWCAAPINPALPLALWTGSNRRKRQDEADRAEAPGRSGVDRRSLARVSGFFSQD
jgi:hypothetical protein